MKNTLIYGATGSAKTTGYMFDKLEEIIKTSKNLIIVDEKKEYFKTFGDFLKNNEYETFVINLDESEKSNGFNILALPYFLYQNNKKDLSLRMLNSIYKEILISKNYKGDSFWINAAANYLVGLTLLLFANGKREEINLGSVYSLMMEYERKSYDKLKDYLESLSVTDSLYAYLSGTVLAPVDTRGGIIATAKERICLYIGSESVLNLLCQNDIELNNLKKPYVLFIFGNEDYAGLTNAIIDEVALYLEDYDLILDNADNLNKIERLDYILEHSFEKKVNTYYISRDRKDLITKYDNNILNKFTEIINSNELEVKARKIGEYNVLPELKKVKNVYINPKEVKLN